MKHIVAIVAMVMIFNHAMAQKNIKLGNYKGEIGISSNSVKVSTNLIVEDGKITGKYIYGTNALIPGEYANCKLKDHVLECDWIESEGSIGTFKAIFNNDYTCFIGVWYYANGSYGGAWTGKL